MKAQCVNKFLIIHSLEKLVIFSLQDSLTSVMLGPMEKLSLI